MIYEREPSPEQRLLIEEPDLSLPLKVVAGAGTGKTFVLAHRFAWLVLHQGLSPQRLLALTFTENAATEMATRIRGLLHRNGRGDTGPLWVHTFHGFAVRLLREHAYRAGRNPDPLVLTELQQALYLEDLLDSTLAGELAALPALHPDRLCSLGVETPDRLRGLLQTLLGEAKGRGLPPEQFRDQALGHSDRLWSALPPAAPPELDKRQFAQQLYQALHHALDLPGSEADDPAVIYPAAQDLLRLYYQNLRPNYPPPREDTAVLLAQAREAERGLLDAAAALYRLYLERLEAEGALDYDGMVTGAVDLLRDPRLGLGEEVRRSFDYLLVDEFQDTSAGQLELVRLLARPRPLPVSSPSGGSRTVEGFERLLVVGDQKQSIYGWRNARPGNLDLLLPLGPRDTVAGRPVCRPLTDTHRLAPELAQIANRAGAQARPQDPALTSQRPPGGLLLCPPPFEAASKRLATRREADFLAREILRLREEGQVEDLCEVAVLIRSRARFRPLKTAFERHGLRYQAQGGVGFFDHPLARDVLAWLHALADPTQDRYLVRLLTRPPCSLSQRELYLLATQPGPRGRRRQRPVLESLAACLSGADPQNPAETAQLPRARLEEFHLQYQRLADLARSAPARVALEEIWRHCAAHAALTASETLATATVRAAFEGLLEQLPRDPDPHLDELVSALRHYQQHEQRELPVSEQPQPGAVQVMTIHAAKGLDFPAVFLLGWWQTARGGPRWDHTWGLLGLGRGGADPKTAAHELLRALGALPHDDEEVRLAYVGLTRAKRVLGITQVQDRRSRARAYPDPAHLAGVPPTEVSELEAAASPAEYWRPALPARLDPLPPRPPDLLRVSFTQLRRLEECPRAWLLARASRGRWEAAYAPDPAGARVGSRFHRYVADFYRGGLPPASAPARGLLTGVQEGLPEAEAQRLADLVAAFEAGRWAALDPPPEVERPLRLSRRVGSCLVQAVGLADLLLPGPGGLVDFKTEFVLTPAHRAEHALQMHLYTEALRAEGLPVEGATIVHVRSQGTQDHLLPQEELRRQAPRLERLLQELVRYAAGEEAQPRPGEPCRRCLFRPLCDAAPAEA